MTIDERNDQVSIATRRLGPSAIGLSAEHKHALQTSLSSEMAETLHVDAMSQVEACVQAYIDAKAREARGDMLRPNARTLARILLRSRAVQKDLDALISDGQTQPQTADQSGLPLCSRDLEKLKGLVSAIKEVGPLHPAALTAANAQSRRGRKRENEPLRCLIAKLIEIWHDATGLPVRQSRNRVYTRADGEGRRLPPNKHSNAVRLFASIVVYEVLELKVSDGTMDYYFRLARESLNGSNDNFQSGVTG